MRIPQHQRRPADRRPAWLPPTVNKDPLSDGHRAGMAIAATLKQPRATAKTRGPVTPIGATTVAWLLCANSSSRAETAE
jgi:hypothetical protein